MADEQENQSPEGTAKQAAQPQSRPVVPADPELLTIAEVAQVLGVELIVAQTIAARGILPPDVVNATNAPDKIEMFWRRPRVEHLKKLRDAEAQELAKLQAAEAAEKKPLKKRSR